jgi:hypothetical protein
MVRVSLAAYNTADDLDDLVEMLVRITEGGYQGAYRPVRESGDFVPVGSTTGWCEIPPHRQPAAS